MMSFVELLGKVLLAEAENAKAIKATLASTLEDVANLQAKIEAFEAQDLIDKENAEQLTEATQILEGRLGELEALNMNPVGDAMAQEIIEAPGETPEAIAEDTAIGTPEPTSEEAVEAISVTFPALVEAPAEDSEIDEPEAVATL